MNTKRLFGNLSLLLAAFIWGTAFVAQDVGMEHVGAFTFQSVRSFIGGIVLLPVIFFRDMAAKRKPDYTPPTKENKKTTLIGGICCGIVLTVASCFQQFGIKYSTVGKAGFITALYVIFVPLCGLFFKKRVRPVVWVSVALATVGLYLLCMTESFALTLGDTLLLICAFSFTAHIMVIDHFSPKVDCVKMSCIQFFIAGIIAAVPMLIIEQPDISSLLAAWLPILYAGALSSGVAYTLQIVGQQHTDPTVASLLMSLESVFAVLAGAVILLQIPTIPETVGCAVMLCAIILAQLPARKKNA